MAPMMLRLTLRDSLTLQGARGTAIDVLTGRVWITEDGRPGDSFVDAGSSYRVGGQGLVLIGAESRSMNAELVVRRSPFGTLRRAAWAWLSERIAGYLAERRTRGALRDLPDHMLHDIGLRRDEIDRYSRMPRWSDSI
jgi:uncharacterized protein YjiS (DUF1127 family)